MYCTHIVYPFLICTVHICVINILHLKCSTQTHTLSGSCLAQVASLFVEAIKVGKMGRGKSLELFPTVLTALSACEALSYGKGKCKLLALVTLTSKTPMSCWVVLSTRCRCYKMMNICLLWLLDIFYHDFRWTHWWGIQETADQQPLLKQVRRSDFQVYVNVLRGLNCVLHKHIW